MITATKATEWLERDPSTNPPDTMRVVMIYAPEVDGAWVTTQHNIDGADSRTWHSRRIEWSMPPTTDALKFATASAELRPLLDRIRDGYEAKWNGSNHIGTYTADASAAIDDVARWIDNAAQLPGENAGLWEAQDWYEWTMPESITADSTDQELWQLANEEDAMWEATESVVLDGTYDLFRDHRDRLKEAANA